MLLEKVWWTSKKTGCAHGFEKSHVMVCYAMLSVPLVWYKMYGILCYAMKFVYY